MKLIGAPTSCIDESV